MITLAVRTPLAKAKKGGFKDTKLDYMVYALLKELVARSKIDPALVEDVTMGNVRLPHLIFLFSSFVDGKVPSLSPFNLDIWVSPLSFLRHRHAD